MENIATPTSEILIFKTSVVSDSEFAQIAALLNNDFRILKWNIDREDVDHVLRIECRELTISQTEDLLKNAGFYCEELID